MGGWAGGVVLGGGQKETTFGLVCFVLVVRDLRSKWTAGIFNFRKSTMILRWCVVCGRGGVNMGGWAGVRPLGAGRKRMCFFWFVPDVRSKWTAGIFSFRKSTVALLAGCFVCVGGGANIGGWQRVVWSLDSRAGRRGLCFFLFFFFS